MTLWGVETSGSSAQVSLMVSEDALRSRFGFETELLAHLCTAAARLLSAPAQQALLITSFLPFC